MDTKSSGESVDVTRPEALGDRFSWIVSLNFISETGGHLWVRGESKLRIELFL